MWVAVSLKNFEQYLQEKIVIADCVLKRSLQQQEAKDTTTFTG